MALLCFVAPLAAQQSTLSKTYLVVTDQTSNNILRFETTGEFREAFVQNTSFTPVSVVFGVDQNLYISSFFNGAIERYNGSTGNYIGRFASSGNSPLRNPWGITFGPDGNLYVVDRIRSAVVRYDGGTGAFIDDFVKPGAGGYNNPAGIKFGPDGNLYVTSGTQSQNGPATDNPQILRFDGATGAFKDIFVSTRSGGLENPYTLLFGPDGNLYVSNVTTHSVLRYQGSSGAFLGAFVAPGSGGLSRPTGMAFGPDGLFYVASSFGNVGILRYNATTGAFVDTFIPAGRGGMAGPTDILFYTFESQVTQSGSAPSVAADPASGNRLLVWTDNQVVNVQPFDSDGHATSAPRVVSPSNESASRAKVAPLGNNLFMLAWDVAPAGGSNANRVRVLPVPASGIPGTLPPPISTPPAAFGDVTPAITSLGGGRAAVVWNRNDSSGRGTGLVGRVIDATGSAVGNEVTLSSTTVSSDESPSIASDENGRTIVTWKRRRIDGSPTTIMAGPTDGALNPVSGAFVVDDGTSGLVGEPAVAANTFGKAALTWPRAKDTTSRVLFLPVTMNLTPTANVRTVNAETNRAATQPALGINPGGQATVSWQYAGLLGGTGIYSRFVNPDGSLDKADRVLADAKNGGQTFAGASVSTTRGVTTIAFQKTVSQPPPDPKSPDPTGGVVTRVVTSPGAQTGCVDDATTVCLSGARFAVSAAWKTSDGKVGDGQAVRLTSDTGYFTFFDVNNVEVVVKVLNACGVNHRYWVFAGGLTNVNVTLTVRDTVTNDVHTYTNPVNTPFQPVQDTGAFATCSAGMQPAIEAESEHANVTSANWSESADVPNAIAIVPAAVCTPNATTICLSGNRYAVSATWRTNDGASSGAGQAVKLTADTGYFTFFDPANVEVVLKVLNACGLNSKYWVFAGGLTNVNVVLTVRDTATGVERKYTNPANTRFQPIQDTSTFNTCP